MKSQGSLVSKASMVALVLLTAGMSAACKKDEAPKPEAKPEPASEASSRVPPRHNTRSPMTRQDPLVMKEYRLDYCYYGTLSLRQARDAYLASMGKDEPSAKKIPNLGLPHEATPPKTPGAPTGSASAGAAPKAPVAAAKPSGSASAGPVPATPADHRMDAGMRLPHERNARSCTAAIGLKEPSMGDVDVQVAAFAPFAVELAKDITAAQTYYQREEFTKDGFARGKELDKKLREEFAKLDELSDKLGAALAAWRKDHPSDASKMEEGEKAARVVIDDAREVLMLAVTKKADGDAWKAALDKLDKSNEALRTYAEAHPTDTWAKTVNVPAEAFIKTVKGAKATPDKGLDADSYLSLLSNFTGLLEGRQRASTRAAMSRPMLPVAVPGASAPTPGQTPPAHPAQ